MFELRTLNNLRYTHLYVFKVNRLYFVQAILDEWQNLWHKYFLLMERFFVEKSKFNLFEDVFLLEIDS